MTDDYDTMCPNCVTPWKCNGPHVPWPPTSSDHPSVTRPDVVEILAAMREDASSVRNRGRITAGNVLILCSEVERLRNALQRIRDLPAYQTPDVAWGIADEALEP